ncbi:hypothetical protein BDV95DRAFT_524210 [Massariosphaeria phaeospora]|uniref:Glycoprotease family protein n=1 Tax=Massariosphaeria phaeospora TaxID=100035 RepID=A0A7C8MKE5_9PLEO|nr:hypothetical protein BDV95DRAFT_524210 [Massariosphaeria phaeospora]
MIPSTGTEKTQSESDAQIAARRAMSKRSSRSYSARITRARSRKKEILGKPAKPGITVDTNVARHRGNAPHLVYPQENQPNSGGTVKKHGWFGLGRSSTRNKGLGITKGTPRPESHSDPKTADALTAGSKTWQEISPWDRPIPIGISVPSDSVPDYSPYQSNRQRSESDTTLVTPSIIITPAQAMKSFGAEVQRDNGAVPVRPRNDTLDSAGTAFEEGYDDLPQKDRITSTATMFEEDEIPLRDRSMQYSALSLDTSAAPTPRRSQGWWNVITTPFVMSRTNSTWTQNGPSAGRTPDVPMMPHQYGVNRASPSSPSTYICISTTRASTAPHNDLSQTQRPLPTSDRNLASPLSTMSTSPEVGTATIGTVLMPRRVDEQSKPINVVVGLHDRRRSVTAQLANATPPPVHLAQTSPSVPQLTTVDFSTSRGDASRQSIPVFAPPPTFAYRSYFNQGHGSRSSTPTSFLELKEPKKHRKVADIMSCIPCVHRNSKDKGHAKKKKNRRRCFWCCGCCLVLMVLLAIIIPVVVVTTRKGDGGPANADPASPSNPSSSSKLLTVAGFPPIPTGVSTVAQPEAREENGCVAPATLWSCSLPKEQHESVKPNKPDQPNFKLEITHQEGSKARSLERAANPATAGAFVRSRFLTGRAAPDASPQPPSIEDMTLLGETTDDNHAPFEGEQTPFFISFQDPAGQESSRLAKRADSDDPTNITAVIPPPMLAKDGTAAPANLYPFPAAQPLRLYNQGKDDEHYGFYTYYDRSIFLKDVKSDTGRGGNPADTDGGSFKDAATLRCTFAQTRFLVQIWTRSERTKPLLQKAAAGSDTALKRPGSFPYPVTVTLDRHGGDFATKNLYCYRMETDGSIKNEPSKRGFQFEDRAFGGALVNGTQGRQNVKGPIDGGTGGCQCQWQNWLA